jgi:hypothetical protein
LLRKSEITRKAGDKPAFCFLNFVNLDSTQHRQGDFDIAEWGADADGQRKRILSVGKFVFVLRFKGKTATMLATINEQKKKQNELSDPSSSGKAGLRRDKKIGSALYNSVSYRLYNHF